MKRLFILAAVLTMSHIAVGQSNAFSSFYSKYKDKGCFNLDLSTGFFRNMSTDQNKDDFASLSL